MGAAVLSTVGVVLIGVATFALRLGRRNRHARLLGAPALSLSDILGRSATAIEGQKRRAKRELQKIKHEVRNDLKPLSEQDMKDQADPPWVSPRGLHEVQNRWAYAALMQRLTLVSEDADFDVLRAEAVDLKTGQGWSFSIRERDRAWLSPHYCVPNEDETPSK